MPSKNLQTSVACSSRINIPTLRGVGNGESFPEESTRAAGSSRPLPRFAAPTISSRSRAVNHRLDDTTIANLITPRKATASSYYGEEKGDELLLLASVRSEGFGDRRVSVVEGQGARNKTHGGPYAHHPLLSSRVNYTPGRSCWEESLRGPCTPRVVTGLAPVHGCRSAAKNVGSRRFKAFESTPFRGSRFDAPKNADGRSLAFEPVVRSSETTTSPTKPKYSNVCSERRRSNRGNKDVQIQEDHGTLGCSRPCGEGALPNLLTHHYCNHPHVQSNRCLWPNPSPAEDAQQEAISASDATLRSKDPTVSKEVPTPRFSNKHRQNQRHSGIAIKNHRVFHASTRTVSTTAEASITDAETPALSVAAPLVSVKSCSDSRCYCLAVGSSCMCTKKAAALQEKDAGLNVSTCCKRETREGDRGVAAPAVSYDLTQQVCPASCLDLLSQREKYTKQRSPCCEVEPALLVVRDVQPAGRNDSATQCDDMSEGKARKRISEGSDAYWDRKSLKSNSSPPSRGASTESNKSWNSCSSSVSSDSSSSLLGLPRGTASHQNAKPAASYERLMRFPGLLLPSCSSDNEGQHGSLFSQTWCEQWLHEHNPELLVSQTMRTVKEECAVHQDTLLVKGQASLLTKIPRTVLSIEGPQNVRRLCIQTAAAKFDRFFRKDTSRKGPEHFPSQLQTLSRATVLRYTVVAQVSCKRQRVQITHISSKENSGKTLSIMSGEILSLLPEWRESANKKTEQGLLIKTTEVPLSMVELPPRGGYGQQQSIGGSEVPAVINMQMKDLQTAAYSSSTTGFPRASAPVMCECFNPLRAASAVVTFLSWGGAQLVSWISGTSERIPKQRRATGVLEV